MLYDVFGFLVLLGMNVILFAGAFHLLYGTTPEFAEFRTAIMTSTFGIFFGLGDFPYENVMLTLKPIFGLIFQFLFVVISVILLLNLLIALLNTTYTQVYENATEKYRWNIVQEYSNSFPIWATPFNIIQLFVVIFTSCCCRDKLNDSLQQTPSYGDVDLLKQELFKNSLVQFFRNETNENNNLSAYNTWDDETKSNMNLFKYSLLHEKHDFNAEKSRDTFEKKMSGLGGQWYGQYWQPDGVTSGMVTMLFFECGKITGEGIDDVGAYRWIGSYSKYSHNNNLAQITMVKNYLGQHSIKYSGYLNKAERIEGEWSGFDWTGEFVFSKKYGDCDTRPIIKQPESPSLVRKTKEKKIRQKTTTSEDADYDYEMI